jgi:hypothetical protein
MLVTNLVEHWFTDATKVSLDGSIDPIIDKEIESSISLRKTLT